jgi:hypothetical protein
MRKTLMAATLVIAMSLTAGATFAATPTEQPQVTTPNASSVTQPRLVSQYLADEIFLPASGVAQASVFAAFGPYPGVCSVTCEECYGSCPPDPDTGLRQSCTYACY